ncbi:LB_137 family protein [Leptospira santarosai]|uniref:LB_137 family protein n=1 Tax=Leptospira santarosai TaxID=28183 RepID=UPI0024AF0B39|nr:hypothetical protein [Leptospira santarosai]MDI7166831.1 hypothetical protein [Leptospira santarosai]MDI7173204.1 hypothetical protein [Leptospira santarosai]MDI7192818.1 hypothetical protein [Leptospira santarosai]MDO6397255.1 hypothetical protein [Leptospira santarosai]MDO6402658.1 hypothetical protein [Leptospira santarosai]
MRKILIYSLLFIFLTTQLQAHRVILKSGEQISGDLKETEGTSDHIIITTEGEDVKIFKKDIAELFFEEAGNHLCIHFKEEPESKCNLKLIRLNVNTLYYIDENNRYRRISFKDLESIRIEEPSTKILEQLSKTRFRIQIASKDKKEILSPIQSVKDETITVQNEPDVTPTLIPKEEIAFLFYKTTEEKKDLPKEKEIQPITILDYLIPGYYIKNQGHTKSGFTLMGLTALFAAGSIYEYIEAKSAQGKSPLLVPQSDGSVLWAEQSNGEFNKHKNLNQLFLISLACTYLFNTVLLTFPATFSFFFQEVPVNPAGPNLHSIEKDQKIEMKININF